MMDREKVKKGLEIILNGCDEIQCEDCCFHIKEPTKPRRCGMIEEQIQEGALALLKEQEAVEPILVREGWNKHHNNYVCPRCDNDVFYEQNYCTECGVRFLWEGEVNGRSNT